MSKCHVHNFLCVAILKQNAQIRPRHCIVVFTMPLTPMQKGRVPMLKYFKHLRHCRRKRIKKPNETFYETYKTAKTGRPWAIEKDLTDYKLKDVRLQINLLFFFNFRLCYLESLKFFGFCKRDFANKILWLD